MRHIFIPLFESLASFFVTDLNVSLLNRSFENNWNTYRMLAHVHLPDTKVFTF